MGEQEGEEERKEEGHTEEGKLDIIERMRQAKKKLDDFQEWKSERKEKRRALAFHH